METAGHVEKHPALVSLAPGDVPCSTSADRPADRSGPGLWSRQIADYLKMPVAV